MQYPDGRRRGLLGQASILTLTSHANRTSPVLRGKWVMEVLLGTPPPPPPPDVPDLEKTGGSEGRPAAHDARAHGDASREPGVPRRATRCMDPIGLALDNFDVTGAWRIRENGVAARHARAALRRHAGRESGRAAAGAAEAVRRRWSARSRENLMAYALGRRVEYYDMPTIRKIVRDAAAHGYRCQPSSSAS